MSPNLAASRESGLVGFRCAVCFKAIICVLGQPIATCVRRQNLRPK